MGGGAFLLCQACGKACLQRNSFKSGQTPRGGDLLLSRPTKPRGGLAYRDRRPTRGLCYPPDDVIYCREPGVISKSRRYLPH